MTGNDFMHKVMKGLRWLGHSLLWVIPLLFALDIASKLLINSWLGLGRVITVIPGFFYLQVLYNQGAAWGVFYGHAQALSVVSLLAGTLFCVILAWKWRKLTGWYKAALYLMIPGAFGNMIDRAFYPMGVIDFLQFHFGSYVFPTFNLADSFLTVGAIVLIIGMFADDRPRHKASGPSVPQDRSSSEKKK